jgi:hypothetical protein
MKKTFTNQEKPQSTFAQANKNEKEKMLQQSGTKKKAENPKLDGAELFSRFTADIIKQDVVFTR